MAERQTLFNLFGDFSSASVWPVRAFQQTVGIIAPGSTPPDPSTWLQRLNDGVNLQNVRTGAAGDRVSVSAELTLDNALTMFPGGFPFVLGAMPDVEFRILSVGGPGKFIQLFASLSDRGVEIVLEGVPVEIRLPAGLVEPPNPMDSPAVAEIAVGSFTSGTLDDLQIIYRRSNPTSIFVHVRVHVNEDLECSIRPSVPISFGECVLSGIPCLAVHDFSLIPSPNVVPQNFDWIRHTVKPWLPNASGPLVGLWAARTVHIDSKATPFKSVSDWLGESYWETEPTAEFVLDDIVVPFFSPYVIPIPRHITVGIRRRILDPGDHSQVYSFSRAPVKIYIQRDPEIALIVESLFYKSLPSEDLTEDLGLTFSAGIVNGERSLSESALGLVSKASALVFGLGENYTITLGYRRGFSSSTGMPDPGSGAAAAWNAILHWELATIVIDIMAFRAGYSIGLAVNEHKSFKDAVEFTVDLFVSMPPFGESADSPVKLRSLNNETVRFALEGIGWRQGSLHLEGLALPDGVSFIFGDTVKLILQELAITAENGATYCSISGGVGWEPPKGFQLSAGVKRLRIRFAGNPNTPRFKLDGFFARAKSGDTLLIEVGGFFTDTQIGDTRVREFGLTGTVGFKLSGVGYVIGVDVLIGSVRSPAESFHYFMFQVFFRGSVGPIAVFELRGVRVLFARNMQPKLQPVDRDSQELRYFNWYKNSNPIDVPGHRRLTAWQSEQDSWALGIGVSASIAAISKVCELGVFVLVVVGNDENGFLIVGEARSGQNPNPLGYFALEWDGKNDRFSLVIGVDLKIRNFVKNAPNWLDNIARLSGTLFISNDPGTFAIGRLADQRTWLSLIFNIDMWARVFIQFGLCIEFVDSPTATNGFGLVVRVEGGINAGIIRISFNAGFGLLVMCFRTGSTDYAVAVWIEAGLRITLFGFLRFGISARGEYRNVGSHPSRGELRIEIRLETPWFLPDVTWVLDIPFGTLEPESLASSASPLRTAAANEGLTGRSSKTHMERFEPLIKPPDFQPWNGEGVTPAYSIVEFRAFSPAEPGRIARFEADSDVHPIATDSTISVDFTVPVNDKVGLKPDVAPNLGDQKAGGKAGALTLKYDLIGILIRRRSRFGSDHSWHALDQQVALVPDFSDPAGVKLSGTISPEQFTKFWDIGIQIGGQPAAKKLLINAKTPFEYQTRNPEIDESIVSGNSDWPCCTPQDVVKEPSSLPIHAVFFSDESPGVDLGAPRTFTESQSHLTFLETAWVRARQLGSSLPLTELVAVVMLPPAGVVFRAEFDEDAAFCFLRAAWTGCPAALQLIAFDEKNAVVGQKLIPLSTGSDFQNIDLPGQGPIRRFEARILRYAVPGIYTMLPNLTSARLEVHRVAYVALEDYLDYLLKMSICADPGSNFHEAYEGRGKLFFLPNHDYEIAVTTRLTIAHPSKPAESADVTEYVYFKTKGLPGLNAVARVGEEIEPYVSSEYTGGRGVLYREEPVTLAFKEDFSVAVPLSLRPPGTSDEHTTLLRMKLLVQPDTAPSLNTTFAATSTDWIVAHRTTIIVDTPRPWKSAATKSISVASPMVSTDPYLVRLSKLTQIRSDGAGNVVPTGCEIADPRNVVRQVLIAPPQGDPDPLIPGNELWPTGVHFTAAVRQEGAPFVDRRGFEGADLTAFHYLLDTGSDGSSAWAVVNNQLHVSSDGTRRFAVFGEASWNHVGIEIAILPGDAVAGVGVSIPTGDVVYQGLFAVVEQSGPNRTLKIYRRDSDVQFKQAAPAPEDPPADLPTSADVNAPIILIVKSFDDVLRASVGDVVLEVQRGALREGRLCLLASSAAQFASLEVVGLDMYVMPFGTSRFRSFADHIHSYRGVLDTIGANALGSGTTTDTTAALWSATNAEIQSIMRPDALASARQTVFDRWIKALGLPLKDDVTTLEISRFAPAGHAEFFLLESPEPLDFTEEVTATLERRDLIAPVKPPTELGRRPDVLRPDPKLMADGLRAQLFRAQGIQAVGPTRPAVESIAVAPLWNLMSNVAHTPSGITVELDPTKLSAIALPQRNLVFVEILDIGGENHMRFYKGIVTPGGATIEARTAEELLLHGTGELSLPIAKELAGLPKGAVATLSPDLSRVIDWFRPTYAYSPVEIHLLQDGPGLRALLIPATLGGTTPLASGTYRMTFRIKRKRWDTTDPVSDLNTYERSAALVLTV